MAQAIEAPQKKEDRRVRRTKKLLTQALTQLLQEKQINEITVKELTDLADMNRGTFYLYYKDMFDMLEKIEDGMFEALDAIISLHEHDDVSQQTKPILLDLFDFIEENQEMCPGAFKSSRGYELPTQAQRSGAGKVPEGMARDPKGKRRSGFRLSLQLCGVRLRGDHSCMGQPQLF